MFSSDNCKVSEDSLFHEKPSYFEGTIDPDYVEQTSPWLAKDGSIHWYQGESVAVEFEIDGQIYVTDSRVWQSLPEFLADKEITLTIYDFRHEEVYKKIYNGITDNCVTLELTADESATLPKGSYSIELKITKNDLNKVLVHKQSAPLIIE